MLSGFLLTALCCQCFNCKHFDCRNSKPRELDEIITSEHSLLQKLRASGLSDDQLLKLVGGGYPEKEKSDTSDLAADFGQQMSFSDKANPYED